MKDEQQKHRFSVDMDATAHGALSELAKGYKITQGEAIEVILAFVSNLPQVERAALDTAFKAKRTAKVAARKPKQELLAAFRKLSPEAQARVVAAAATAVATKQRAGA